LREEDHNELPSAINRSLPKAGVVLFFLSERGGIEIN